MAGRGNPMPHLNGANRFIRNNNPDFRYHSIEPHPSKGTFSLYDSTYEKRDFRDGSPFGPSIVRDRSPFGPNGAREPSPYGLGSSREPSPFQSNMRRDPSPFCGGNVSRETSPYVGRETRDSVPYFNSISGRGLGRFSVRDDLPFRPGGTQDGPSQFRHNQSSVTDNHDRRIAVVNAAQTSSEPSDKRIAVQSPPNSERGRQTRSSSYSSNDSYNHRRGGNSKDTLTNSSLSNCQGPSTGKPTSNSGDAIINNTDMSEKERYEKEKKKELERIRKHHRKMKEESSKTKDKDSKCQKPESLKAKNEDSDTELEDERVSPANGRRHKGKSRKRSHSRSSHGSHRRRSPSISSQKSSRRDESLEVSPTKVHKQSPSNRSPKSEDRKTFDSPRSDKFSPKSLSPAKRRVPQYMDDNSQDNTVEEGELKSSESSQCDDLDIPKHKTDFDQKPSDGTETLEDLKRRNIELELELKALKNELLNEKKAVERLFKDNDTKIENQQEYYHDDLESLRKEVAYYKKENDRERDSTDMAKSKERDLLNKVRRLEDSLMHSGKENLDLKEKLRRLTEENDSFRYGNYSRYPPVTVTPPVQTFRYQQPHPPPW